MNIAMWSGPRNLSTAMMYSFAQRDDCAVMDEPFYAAFLRRSGAPHPMAAEIIAAHEPDPAAVARRCAAPAPDGRAHLYQKQMTHHMLPGFDLSWMAACRTVFLIRHPARVVTSYHDKIENPTLADIGAAEQVALYDEAVRLGDATPLVIDSADVRRAPEAMLRALCEALGIGFQDTMLAWPAGGRPEDGVWAAHWYAAVHGSTGFAAAEGPLPDVPGPLRAVCAEAMPYYETLRARALKP